MLVLRRFAMRPLPGVRITLIAREIHTPYSGMLPGYVAGYYRYDDIHIDLGPLALAAGARLIAQEAVGIDLAAQRVEFEHHPALRFDVLSLNCGAAPGFGSLEPTAAMIPVKPIGRFLPRWHALLDSLRARSPGEAPARIVIVGGGAGGVELALAVRHALVAISSGARVTLVGAAAQLLEGHSSRVQHRFAALLTAQDIDVVTDFEVTDIDAVAVSDRRGRRVSGDAFLWATGVAAPQWLRGTGLALDPAGFVAVDQTLRSVSNAQVFAAGDVAAMLDQPRAKSGVYAVRQAPVLAENLRRALLGEPLRSFRAQRRVLALISEGRRSATASRGRLTAHGEWVWRWKDWIDRRFMRRFSNLPAMMAVGSEVADAFAADLPQPMRCGGCGAKLGADLLGNVLRQLQPKQDPRLAIGIGDDAALFDVPGGQIVLSADSLRTMLDDPYEFGRIAARHALNDIHAMGCTPVTALALASVPLMGRAQMEQELLHLMCGATEVLREEDVSLAGGHSSEGNELALGFAIVGDVAATAMRKQGLTIGDALVITRPIGSGVLFAAQARGLARTRWIRAAIETMDSSNAPAARILRQHDTGACTDITGFGLVGHLGEMLRASEVAADVNVSAVPLYEGALQMMHAGVASSLQTNNESALRDFVLDGCVADATRIRLLADPQTAGGLLAGLPVARAEACVSALRAAGYREAAIIGQVVAKGAHRGTLRFREDRDEP